MTTIPPKPNYPPTAGDWMDRLYGGGYEFDQAEPESEPQPPAPEEPSAAKPRWRVVNLRKLLDLGAHEKDAQPDKPPKPGLSRPKTVRKKPKRRDPATPRSAWDTSPPAPRQSLIDAWNRIPSRLKWLAFHATAAAAGWRIGWVNWSTDTAAWFAANHWTSGSAWVLYALGLAAVALYWRARTLIWPAAWCAAVPVSSVVVGILLYGTGYHT